MKRSLLFKLILCFFICSACFFGLINSAGRYFIEQKIIESKNGELNRAGTEILDNLSSYKFDHTSTKVNIELIANEISKTLDCKVLIASEDHTYTMQIGDEVTSDDCQIAYQGKFSGDNGQKYTLNLYRSLDCI